MLALYLVLGTIFGFVLSRSGAADYNHVHGMFLFERFQHNGIIGTTVVLRAPGLWLIQRRGRTALGAPVQVELKPMTRGAIEGSVLFGIGWSIAGMCRAGSVNIGQGKICVLAALAGALTGAGLFGMLYARLQGRSTFRLSPGRRVEARVADVEGIIQGPPELRSSRSCSTP